MALTKRERKAVISCTLKHDSQTKVFECTARKLGFKIKPTKAYYGIDPVEHRKLVTATKKSVASRDSARRRRR